MDGLPDYPIDKDQRLLELADRFQVFQSQLARAASERGLVVGALMMYGVRLLRAMHETRGPGKHSQQTEDGIAQIIAELETQLGPLSNVIPLCYRLFLATANQMYVHIAFLLSQGTDAGVPPQWVLDELVIGSADFLGAFAAREPGASPRRAFAEAFDVTRAGGGSIWSEFADTRPLEVGIAIATRRAEAAQKGELIKAETIVQNVAKEHNISIRTAWRHWEAYLAVFPEFAELFAETALPR